ncbi:MAG: DUF3352 domain-containing protein [Bacteroidota bacterium]
MPNSPLPIPPKKKKSRWLLYTFLLLILGGGSFAFYKYYLVPTESFQAIYLVPKNAIYFIETEEPVKNWQHISESKVWKYMRTQPYFGALTASANSLDSLLADNARLFDLFGSRHVLVSAHVYRKNTYDFLFIVDLEKTAKLKFLQEYLTNLSSQGFRITRRSYKGQSIIELYDKASRQTLHLAFVENLLVCSYVHTLVEAAIDQKEEPFIGRDFRYIDIDHRLGGKGLFNVYLQYAYFDEYMRCYMSEGNEYVTSLSKSLGYSGMNFDLDDDGKMTLEGYTNINDSISPYLKAMLLSGKGKLQAQEVIPQRTAFYMSLTVDNFTEFYDNFRKLLEENTKANSEYLTNLNKVEKYLKISLQKNFIEWIGQEVAFVQTQPTGLGKSNEFAVIIKAKAIDDAKENLAFVTKQINKKTPVKFKDVPYKGYLINYMSVKGFFKLFLGNFFEKLDKPYYTIIDDYVVMSNHPQTIKSIISDYVDGKTLEKSDQFNDFFGHFKASSNIFIYVQTPVLHNNLKGFVSPVTWAQVNKNKPYIVCFPQIGMQLIEDGGLFETKIVSNYQDLTIAPPKEELLVTTDSTAKTAILEPVEEEDEPEVEDEISLDDLDVKKYEEKYADGAKKVEVTIKNGLRNGTYREFYTSGETKVKGHYEDDRKTGTWKYYDENGKLTEKKKFENGEEVVD